jgi:hypothetical protein
MYEYYKYDLLDTFYYRQHSPFSLPISVKNYFAAIPKVWSTLLSSRKNLVQMYIGKVHVSPEPDFVRVFVL